MTRIIPDFVQPDTIVQAMNKGSIQEYRGFEQGPIRPPSEAGSLLIRVTRNCPWNKCTFCSVYKNEKFSLRPVDHVIRDIDSVHDMITAIRNELDENPEMSVDQLRFATGKLFGHDKDIFYSALNWLVNGEGAVFLQDANSLVQKPGRLAIILDHLRSRFPWITRITSYARSHTINRLSDAALEQLAGAGLNRIHIGMESGSDKVLTRINKGVTKQGHIDAGQKVKTAGIQLSEYIMPGIGGRDLSDEHAQETADALNRINPDYIRLRTLSIMRNSPLYAQYHAGKFSRNTELQTIMEIRKLVEHLEGITSTLKSDHVYNLLQEMEGVLPRDRDKMIRVLDDFLELNEEDQVLFQLGKRMGYFHLLTDLQSGARKAYVNQLYNKLHVTPQNIDQILERNSPNYI